MHDRLAAEAAQLGLRYNFDAAVIANTFDAHRVTHLARERGLQERMEERLFAAYFSEGRNIEDHATLADLAAQEALDRGEAMAVLGSAAYADAVRADIELARRLGADGVPFYVFNSAYAVSGAQPSDLFLEVLTRAWEEQAAEGVSAGPSAAGPAAPG
jgi:predicted DsbA family dithiol-disulfide isomerase